MNHIKALAIKFISSLVLLYIILGLMNGMSFGNVFLITLVLGVLSYIIGDLFILSRTNNLIATLADFGLALLVIWMMSESLVFGEWFAEALLASIGVAIFEYMFHKYVIKNVIGGNQMGQDRPSPLRFQTEASEELIPKTGNIYNNNEDDI